ncbi:MAG: 50S ribosomal protein L1 [Cellvibrionales bacterium]|nr:50S ribosomal protein L1 [Cellvibrionales bacterium]
MAKLTRRMRAVKEKIEPGRVYGFIEAAGLLKALSSVKFTETVDVAINLGIDPRKSDQVVRGATTLPKGTGKTVRVAVFAQGDNAEAAKKAGADAVGMEDLAEKMKGGDLDFGTVIATPDAMRVVGALGPLLGPRGLMPNPKTGTVTATPAVAVDNAKAGQIRFRTDKNGIIHGGIGKLSFPPEDLQANLQALLADLKKLKPASAKGVYLQKAVVSTTMGPGIPVDIAALEG